MDTGPCGGSVKRIACGSSCKRVAVLFKGVSIEAKEEPGPTSREHVFTENSIKVTIKNDSGIQISIEDIRLMFSRNHGFPVLPQAPTGRDHLSLPAPLDSGRSLTWHFPAERMASFLDNLSTKSAASRGVANLRPRVTTTTGRTYKGRKFTFSLNVNSHWGLGRPRP